MTSSSAAAGASPARPWADDPLAWLIGPDAAAGFLEQTYERAPLVVRRDDPARFRELLSIAAIDRLISGSDLREGMVDLADASRSVDRSAYVTDSGVIDRGVIAHEHARGATIILQQLHQADATLAAFCRAMEAAFSCHVQTNIYLTPPGAQGFRTHYDNHDVFVLQIEGEKAWRFYGTPVETPYRGEGFEHGKHETGEVTHEFVLKAGDCAYLPRGLMHDASTSGDGPSLHITCGLIVKTWADLVLEAVSEVALNEPAFRRSLPPGYARRDYDRSEAEAVFRRLVAMLPDKARLDGAFDLMVDTFVRSREPDVAGAVLAAGLPVDPAARYGLRKSAPWRLAEDGDELVLIAPGGDLEFSEPEHAALRRALSGEPFGQSDLDCSAPAAMIRRLQGFGLIEQLDG